MRFVLVILMFFASAGASASPHLAYKSALSFFDQYLKSSTLVDDYNEVYREIKGKIAGTDQGCTVRFAQGHFNRGKSVMNFITIWPDNDPSALFGFSDLDFSYTFDTDGEKIYVATNPRGSLEFEHDAAGRIHGIVTVEDQVFVKKISCDVDAN
jgi:hypothetical protein